MEHSLSICLWKASGLFFSFLAITNGNTCLKAFASPLPPIPRSAVAGGQRECVLNFVRNSRTCFRSGRALSIPAAGPSSAGAPHPHRHLPHVQCFTVLVSTGTSLMTDVLSVPHVYLIWWNVEILCPMFHWVVVVFRTSQVLGVLGTPFIRCSVC